MSQTNPYRNGILSIVDTLIKELNIGELEALIVRERLKAGLRQSTETKAQYFIDKVHNMTGRILNDNIRRSD